MAPQNDRHRTTSTNQIHQQVEELLQVKPRRRWRRWLVGFTASLLVVVLMLPTLISNTPLPNHFLAMVMPSNAGSILIQDLNIGWFTPLSASQITLSDAAGETLLSVQHIAGDRRLWDLVRNPTVLGTIQVTEPRLSLTLRADGSNWEDLLEQFASLLESDPSEPDQDTRSTGPTIDVSIECVDVQVIATEIEREVHWTAQFKRVAAHVPSVPEQDWKFEAEGELDGQPLSASLAAPLGLATTAWPLGPHGSASLRADNLSIMPLRYAAARAGQPVDQLQGRCSSDISVVWQPNPASSFDPSTTQSSPADPSSSDLAIPALNVAGFVRADDIVVVADQMLGQDVLKIQSVQLQTKLRTAGEAIIVDQLQLESDFGDVFVSSELTWPGALESQLGLGRLDSWYPQKLTARGQIDLAALAQSLPNTLQVRQDIHIADGKVQWALDKAGDARQHQRWSGKLATKDIRVLRDGQPLDWQLPLDVDFAVLQGNEWELEKLTAVSSFFAMSGQGTLQQGTIQARANLEQFLYQWGQVFDVSGVDVRGQLQSTLHWREVQPQQVTVESDSQLNGFSITQDHQVLCQEANLNVSAQAATTLNGHQIASLDKARVDVQAGTDFLVAELQQPVANPGWTSSWQWACRLRGELGQWLQRVPVGLGPSWQIAGQVDITAQAAFTLPSGDPDDTSSSAQPIAPGRLDLQSLTVDLRNLHAVSDGITVSEPVVQVQSSGTIDLNTGNCRFVKTQLSSHTVSCTTDAFTVSLDPERALSGNIDYRASVERLLAIAGTSEGQSSQPGLSQPSQKIQGEATGRIALHAQAQTTSFQWTGAIANLQVVQPDATKPLWQEPEVTISIEGRYEAESDTLQLVRAEIGGQAVNLAATGDTVGLTTNPQVQLQGEMGYDLTGLTALLRDALGPDIQLTGQQRHAFAVQGPVLTAPGEQGFVALGLQARFQAGWQTANAYGIPLGPTQLNLAIQNGVLNVQPLDIAVGQQGHVRLAPTVYLNTDAMWMTMPAGPLVDRIRIDPRMTAGWMKYVTPLLADATSAEGTFSVLLGKTQVPLMEPQQAQVEGKLTIHGGLLGPGPMASQMLALATQIKRVSGQGQARIVDPTKTWVSLGEQQVDFRMVDGRVYHRGFQMTVDGVPIRTQGSVGIVDQSLDVVATVPVMDDWIRDSPQLAGLRGQVIQVPIRGTASRPQLDQRVLTQATMQLARQGISGYLQNQLSERLGGRLQGVLGGPSNPLGETPGTTNPAGPQTTPPPTPLETQLQNEISNQLNRLFQ